MDFARALLTNKILLLNGQFTQKCKSCHDLLLNPQVVPNLYQFLSSAEHKMMFGRTFDDPIYLYSYYRRQWGISTV